MVEISRLEIAALAMQGLLSHYGASVTPRDLADDAILMANALIEALPEEKRDDT